MLKLHGFAGSIYCNIVHMTLLEKGVAFEYVKAFPSQEEDYLSKNPIGKVPCIEVDGHFLSEAAAIVEYLEETIPSPRLVPTEPFARARVRELMRECELYVDLAVRPCYPEVFEGGSVSDEVRETSKINLWKGLAALRRRARFEPYVAGRDFSFADVYLFACFPYAQIVAARYDWGDIAAELPGVTAMVAKVAERDSAKALAAAQKMN